MVSRWSLIGILVLACGVVAQTEPASSPVESKPVVISSTLPASAPETESVPAPPDQPSEPPGETIVPTEPIEPATTQAVVTQPESVPAEAETQTAPLPPAATQPTRPVTSLPARQPNDTRPNIILLVCEDLPAGRLGVEGNAKILTPNLDRLALEGALFTRAYTPTPQLSPAMASILTGQYAQTHGVTTEDVPLPARVDAFTTRLKKAGYACGFVGSWPLDPAKAAQPGLGLTDYTASVAPNWNWENCDVWVNGQAGKADQFLSDWMADRAVEFVDQAQAGPFLLWVNFRELHEPFVYPPRTEQLYPPASIEMPAHEPIHPSRRPNAVNVSTALQKYRSLTEPQLREARSQYQAMLTHMDACVGRILTRIDQGMLWRNTCIVFTSTRGRAVGEMGLFGTALGVQDLFVRVPMIVRFPAACAGNVRNDRVVSLVDLAPTCLQLAGLDVPITCQGQSLLPLLENPRTTAHADERFFVTSRDGPQIMELRGLVTKQYKFITNVSGGGGELYDLKRDPQEKHNALTDSEYQAVVQVLQTRLQRWREETRDSLVPARR